MSNSTSLSAQTLLSTLSSDAQESLRNYFRQEIASELVGGGLVSSRPRIATQKPEGKRTIKRLVTQDGRSGSEWIREWDSQNRDDNGDWLPAKAVIEAGTKVGLEIPLGLVYNVRNQLKQKQAKAVAEIKKVAKNPSKKTPKKTVKKSKTSKVNTVVDSVPSAGKSSIPENKVVNDSSVETTQPAA